MKIVLKQSDFSDPAILVQRNQQLKRFDTVHDAVRRVPAILVQRNQHLKRLNRSGAHGVFFLQS